MKREIFKVDAYIVDANGTYNSITGYPKTFDSKNYQDDVEKAKQRAHGDCCDVFQGMCKIDNRKLQVAMVIQCSDGLQLRCEKIGKLTDQED